MNSNYKTMKRQRRHARIRSTVSGTADMPRLSVFRSNAHIYAQIIDDVRGVTLAASSDIKDMKGTKAERSVLVGTAVAQAAQKAGIKAVVFDRGGFRYTGRIKALADAARTAGLSF
jgi:large subunit ribosomal protein L18